MNENKYGMKARVRIVFQGDLEQLSVLLQEKLNIPEFWFDTDEQPPHGEIGFCEVFGLEVEIKNFEGDSTNYILDVITTDSFTEIAAGRMYDISQWLADYIAFSCKLTTFTD
ncbi:hypothetical protein [Enterococcus sp. BWR-S5]|uniref:hypothetical protein n=1 Tax=Enterococcus sp. BWR-S5 TaxID=2787714 RepID=UPI001924BF48|nr:hypothetical protein [Enterococcus sp. BWR-S5]MBL1224619.1 hypothetical protein [Enterococcus sp. BWR-S5]